MSASAKRRDDQLGILRFRGVITKSDPDAVQSRYVRSGDPGGQSKLLVVVEDFEGWEAGAAWDDLKFFFTHGDSIPKIDLVGEPHWEVDAVAIAGAGIRTEPVRYHATTDEAVARSWMALGVPCQDHHGNNCPTLR